MGTSLLCMYVILLRVFVCLFVPGSSTHKSITRRLTDGSVFAEVPDAQGCHVAECTNWNWYFVSEIILTYCEKKLFVWLRKTFEIRGRKFVKILRSQKQFIQTVKSQYNFWNNICSWKFQGLVLVREGSIDAKGIDFAQPIWSSGCLM